MNKLLLSEDTSGMIEVLRRRYEKSLELGKILICLFTFFFQGSRDNMSIIIIAFPGAPKVDPDAVRKEDELNKLIKQKVTGNFSFYFFGRHSKFIMIIF